MPLSAYQLWQHKRKGKQYCQAWIMRDNEIIGTVNEPFNTDKFEWDGRTFIRKESADIIWGGRDIYIYEYDDTLGKVLTVKDAIQKDPKKKENKDQDECDILIGTKISPTWVSRYLGNNVVEQAISGTSEKKTEFNVMTILIGIIILIMVIYVFLG